MYKRQEINYTDGVTSNIQTQLDAKGTSSVDELKELDDVNIANNTMLIGNTADNMVTAGDNKAASNIGIGRTALDALTNADYNVAIGQNAAQSITTGSQNIAIGFNALNKSVAAVYNVAIGNNALKESVSGGSNTAVGWQALNNVNAADGVSNSGTHNTAVGRSSQQVSTLSLIHI